MYLKTQIKSTVHRHTPMIYITDDDSDLLNPVFPGNEGEDAVSQILGTSEEREQLKSKQEQELIASMARDRERQEETRRVFNKETEKANWQLRLQKARIEMEPEESQSNVKPWHNLKGLSPLQLNDGSVRLGGFPFLDARTFPTVST